MAPLGAGLQPQLVHKVVKGHQRLGEALHCQALDDLLPVPNHQLADIQLQYTATDVSGTPICALTVASNEPMNGTGDGSTSVDWTIFPNDPHHVQLRAERAGTGNGRIYTITATCSDRYGYSTSNSTTVRVPK